MFMRVNAVDLTTQIKCHLEPLTLLGTSTLHVLRQLWPWTRTQYFFSHLNTINKHYAHYNSHQEI